jgi:glycosyltransferase involved in cell wall biosynthesis
MRILFCPCHYLFDDSTYGSEYGLAFEIADFFGRKYPESVVVTGKIHLTSQRPYKIIGLLKENDNLGQSISSALHFNYKYTILALRLLKQEKFDIIHHVRPFNVGTTFNLIPLLGLNRKTPFVIGSFCSPYPMTHNPQDMSLKKIALRLMAPIVYWLSIKTLKRSTKIIVHDGATKKLLTRHLSESKIVIIPPGEKDRPFRLSRSKYYQPKFELLSVGFLIERKGYDIVLRAIAEAVQHNPNITLRIVGDGKE